MIDNDKETIAVKSWDSDFSKNYIEVEKYADGDIIIEIGSTIFGTVDNVAVLLETAKIKELIEFITGKEAAAEIEFKQGEFAAEREADNGEAVDLNGTTAWQKRGYNYFWRLRRAVEAERKLMELTREKAKKEHPPCAICGGENDRGDICGKCARDLIMLPD